MNKLIASIGTLSRQGRLLLRQLALQPQASFVRFYRTSLFRWLAAGFAFLFINSVFMMVLVENLKFHTFYATFISAELCTILRFFINEHWVFRMGGPFWKRFWQFHLANASSFLIWLIVANYLIHIGIHYLISSVLAVGISILTSLFTNFLWVWRQQGQAPSN